MEVNTGKTASELVEDYVQNVVNSILSAIELHRNELHTIEQLDGLMLAKHETIADKLKPISEESEKVKALRECLAELEEAESTVNDLDLTLTELEAQVDTLANNL